MNKKIFCVITSLSLSHSVWALDLVEAYQRALNYDATWQANQTRYLVEQRNLGIAKGAVLPTVSVNALLNKQYQDIDKNNAMNLGGGQTINFIEDETTTKQVAVSIRQPLFRMDVWQKYKQVEISTELAELSLQRQKQSLLLDVAQSYFDLLRQQSLQKLNQKEEQVLLQQYNMMQAKFKQGFVAKMDVSEAQAQYQSAGAKKVASSVQVQLAKEKLEQLIGTVDSPLEDLNSSFVFQAPVPNDVSAWVDLADRNNLELNQNRLNYRVALQQVKIDQADYYPQLEAVASSAWVKQSPENVISTNGRNDKIGLELNWTPYTGTRSAIIEKSRVAAKAAEQDIDAATRRIRTDVKGSYLQVATAQTQLQAYQTAMESAQLVAKASQASYQEGLKTMVDVLLAQRNAFAAEQDFLNAKYDYLLNVLKLKAASGQLAEQDLQELNQWLVVE